MSLARLALLALLASLPASAMAQPATDPVGIALEGYPYPHPVSFLPVTLAGEALRMAYMDVPPSRTGRASCSCMAATFRRATGSPSSGR